MSAEILPCNDAEGIYQLIVLGLFTHLSFIALEIFRNKYNANKGLRMKHVLQIGLQLLRRIKALHSLNFVHGDIKPGNLMFGRGVNKNTLYLIDYGMTREESDVSSTQIDESIYDRKNLDLTGTPLYASINLHLGWDKVFKLDDIESFVYLLIRLAKGTLPWSDISAIKNDNFFEILR